MKKILFIEDAEALQTSLADYLKNEGYEVLSAYDGEKGFATAVLEKPDLILLDLILPKKSGFEVLDGLKKNEETKNIPVMILTNLEGIHDVEKALSMGAFAYLIKANYELSDVSEKIKEILK